MQHAYEHTEYYHALFDEYDFNPYKIKGAEDLEKLPVLTKETLINDLDKMAADDIEDVYSVATGGTTGKSVKVFMEKMPFIKNGLLYIITGQNLDMIIKQADWLHSAV